MRCFGGGRGESREMERVGERGTTRFGS